MSTLARFTNTVGVAPGTTTMSLGQLGGTRRWNPWTDLISLNGEDTTIAPPVFQDRPIRWDLVAIIGGGSLIVALGAAFIASALRAR